MTVREQMLAGQLYRAGSDPEIKEEFLQCRRLTQQFNATGVDQAEERDALLRQLLGAAGTDLTIEPTFRCDYGKRIFVGDHFYANFDCVILDVCEVRFGDHCLLGPRVNIYTATHPIDADVRASGLEFGRPVTVGNHVWIGGNTVVCPGVTIGDGAIIGAGSVVTADIPGHVIAFGNPCRIHRAITEQDRDYWNAQQATYYAGI